MLSVSRTGMGKSVANFVEGRTEQRAVLNMRTQRKAFHILLAEVNLEIGSETGRGTADYADIGDLTQRPSGAEPQQLEFCK